MQILLADDKPQVRSALRLFLELEPEMKIVAEVDDARDLLNSVETHNPDLLFLDWELPGFSKESLLPLLRRDRPDLSIIALSGHFESRKNALNAGVEAFVSKTHPPHDLISVLRRVKKREGQKKRALVTVGDWMTRDIVTISPEATVLEAYRHMTQNRIRRLPVLDGRALVGIVTMSDICRVKPCSTQSPYNTPEVNRYLNQINVKAIMTSQPVTITPSTTITQAAGIMLKRRISGLPVLDDAYDLVGIITESDIFRVIVQNWRSGQNLAI